jgi:hypothetical protein
VWNKGPYYLGGHGKFFRVALSTDNLTNYYKTNFALMQHHKYSLTELEDMMPFEREVYIMLLTQYVKEENERQKQQEAQARSRKR